MKQDDSSNLASNTVGLMFRLESLHLAKNGRLKVIDNRYNSKLLLNYKNFHLFFSTD